MRRHFPTWFYTPSVGSVLLIALLWLSFHNFDVLGKNGGPTWYWAFSIALACASVFLTYVLVKAGDEPLEAEPEAPPIRYRAYLVLHINTRQHPPVVTFAHVYSASARDLTLTGGEAHADLYSLTADSYHEAHEELMQIIPLYFPWVVPLLTRQQ
jgi:hypothetical protein